jgi:hypothetical protein
MRVFVVDFEDVSGATGLVESVLLGAVYADGLRGFSVFGELRNK